MGKSKLIDLFEVVISEINQSFEALVLWVFLPFVCVRHVIVSVETFEMDPQVPVITEFRCDVMDDDLRCKFQLDIFLLYTGGFFFELSTKLLPSGM